LTPFSLHFYRLLEPKAGRRRRKDKGLIGGGGAPAQGLGASHNDQAVNTQHLAFMSLHRDIYHEQETEES
jgi:hypothetical protein